MKGFNFQKEQAGEGRKKKKKKRKRLIQEEKRKYPIDGEVESIAPGSQLLHHLGEGWLVVHKIIVKGGLKLAVALVGAEEGLGDFQEVHLNRSWHNLLVRPVAVHYQSRF